MENAVSKLNRQCRFVLDDDGVVTPWYSYGNVTFFDAIRQHCRESGLASKYRVNIVEVRCESDPEKIDRFEVKARIDWDILNPRLGVDQMPPPKRTIWREPTQADLNSATEPIPCRVWDTRPNKSEKTLVAIDKFSNDWRFICDECRWRNCEIEVEE